MNELHSSEKQAPTCTVIDQSVYINEISDYQSNQKIARRIRVVGYGSVG